MKIKVIDSDGIVTTTYNRRAYQLVLEGSAKWIDHGTIKLIDISEKENINVVEEEIENIEEIEVENETRNKMLLHMIKQVFKSNKTIENLNSPMKENLEYTKRYDSNLVISENYKTDDNEKENIKNKTENDLKNNFPENDLLFYIAKRNVANIRNIIINGILLFPGLFVFVFIGSTMNMFEFFIGMYFSWLLFTLYKAVKLFIPIIKKKIVIFQKEDPIINEYKRLKSLSKKELEMEKENKF
ncbi:MAG: hypothetical protein FWF57_01735 [Defluviitaleaceae bacterium]|nr:hypothetical protein [Defluviitaleaceae bacterium]